MADRSNFFIMQLFHEMKQRFPAIPDRVVSECIRQNFNDKQICEAVLTVKNRNYSHRLFPPPHMSKMLPASSNDGVSAVGAIDISATESETESSRCEDDDNTCGSSIASETEDSEANRVTRKRTECVRIATQTASVATHNRTSKSSSTEKSDTQWDTVRCNSSEPFQVPPNLRRAEGVRVATQTASASTCNRTSTSSTAEESDNQWSTIRSSSCEPFQVPPNFGSQLSQEGCGRGIGGGCCCRHAEDMDFLRQFNDGGGMANVGERIPIRYSGTVAPVLPQADNDLAIDGLGDSDFFRDNLGDVTKNTPVTNYRSRNGAPPLMSVSVPGVRPPPSSHMPNLSDLSTQTSNLNISAPVLGSDFDCFKQLPEERTSRGMDGMDYEQSRNQIPSTDSLSPTYKPPYTYDPNIVFGEPSFMDDPPVLPHDVEDFLRCDVKLRTTGGSSHFIDCEDESGYHLGGKGETSTSSTVKVGTSSPFASQLNRKHTNPPGLQPAPVFAGQSRFQGKKDSPPSLGRPITPTNYSNASVSPTSSQTPLSFTRVNFTLRQPSSDPLPPIDIRSSVGDSRLTYTSASSYYPQQAFQSELQIRIGGGAGISSGSGYGPITPSWKPPSPQQSGKNPSPNQPPVPQMRPSNQSSRLQVPTDRSGEKQHHSPLPTRREHPERPRSLCRPSSPGDVGSTPQVSGSLPDVSKARSFVGEHDSYLGVSSRQTGVHHQHDPRVRPNSSVPSSPASGLPPPRPSTATHSPKDRNRVPGTAPSLSSIDHSRSTTCADVSRCKARLLHQIERKNLLERELNREREKLKTMQENVKMMEKDLQQRQMQQRTHATYPIIQRVHTLRHEIQILQDECKKMTNEVDLNSDIQVPLGETDEEFYKNIYTGQQGWVLLPPINAQFHASQRPENLHQQAREFRERCRDNPVPPGMEVPGGLEGGRMRGGAGEGIGLGPGAGGEGPNWTCSMCTFRNHPALDKCEECEMPRINLEGRQTQDIHIHVTHHNFPMRRVVHSWVV